MTKSNQGSWFDIHSAQIQMTLATIHAKIMLKTCKINCYFDNLFSENGNSLYVHVHIPCMFYGQKHPDLRAVTSSFRIFELNSHLARPVTTDR